MKKLISTICIAVLAGCMPPPKPYEMTTTFSEADFLPWKGDGSANVSGQAFLKTVVGDVKTCAGEKVALIPATAYMREFFTARKNGRATSGAVSSPSDYARFSLCDAAGNFSFQNVMEGDWIVLTQVGWDIPTGRHSIFFPELNFEHQGGEMARTVSLHKGDNRAILTAEDRIR